MRRKYWDLEHSYWAWLISLLAALAIVAAWLLMPRPTHAANEHIVTIYDDGQQQTVASSATTVAELLRRVGIQIGQQDTVEPGLSTKLTTGNYSINIYRAEPATIIADGHRYHIVTPLTNPRDIVRAAGINLYDEDTVTTSRIDDFVSGPGIGLLLNVHRSTPVTLVLYDHTLAMRTQAMTVEDFLREKHVVVNSGDSLYPDPSMAITANLIVALYRQGSQAIEQQPIAFATRYVYDTGQPVNYRHIQTPGVNGVQLVIDDVGVANGKQVKTILQTVVLHQPSDQVVVIGTKTAGFGGGFADALARLRSCEGHYTSINARAANPSNWYYGAYQFNTTTWASYAPDGYKNVLPSDAPPSIQDQAAANLYKKRGWQPWPTCSVKMGLQDIYR